MIKQKTVMGIAVSVLMISACSTSGGTGLAKKDKPKEASIEMFSASRIRADVEFLASDLLKGRDTGSEGHEIAASYVSTQYKQLGLKPMGEDGSYFQRVPFATGTIDAENSSLSITVDGETTILDSAEDYFMGGSVRALLAEGSGELVFAGYGVHAPELGYSDFDGIDLKGKIAVIFRGAPGDLGSEVRSHYRRADAKAAVLEEAGAVGYLLVSDRATEKRIPFARYKAFGSRGRFSWTAPDNQRIAAPLPANATISWDVATRLFEGAEMSFEETLNAQAEGTMKSFPLKPRAAIKKGDLAFKADHQPQCCSNDSR